MSEENETQLWTEKYAPKHSRDVIANKTLVAKMKAWLENWPNEKKKSLLLVGSAGTGKTSSVYALASELNYTVIEMNASDFRNKDKIEQRIKPAALCKPLFDNTKRLILLDEIDGLSGHDDRGGAAAIVDIIKKSLYPIICTANDAYSKKISSIKRISETLTFRHLTAKQIAAALITILHKEKIGASHTIVEQIAENAAGDIRAAVRDLQYSTIGSSSLTEDNISTISSRNQEKSIFKVVPDIFNAQTVSDALAAKENLDADYELLVLYLFDNMHKVLTDTNTLASVFSYFSKADTVFNLIKSEQNWKLLPSYFDLTIGSAALHNKKHKSFIRIDYPQTIIQGGRIRKQKAVTHSISTKLKKTLFLSNQDVWRHYIPYLKEIFRTNIEMAQDLSITYDFNKEDITFLCSDTAKDIYIAVKEHKKAQEIKIIKSRQKKTSPPPKVEKKETKEQNEKPKEKSEKKAKITTLDQFF